MYSSTYLNWFRRLLILGAVVAGLTASAAGARLDPGTPPDVSDVASGLSTASFVSSPPDVQDAAASANAATPDVFERYATAHPYGSGLSQARLTGRELYPSLVERVTAQEQGGSTPASSSFVSRPPDVQDAAAALYSTPEGLKADGLRWQGIARAYELVNGEPASQLERHYQHEDALYQLSERAASFPTPQGLRADGLRYQRMAQVYKGMESAPVSGGGSSFSWNDWAIGIGTGIGLALLLGAGLLVGRQHRQRVQPA
jgi:hypothetical protein